MPKECFNMSLLEDPEIKKTYDKCKYIVKAWEHQFTKKHKRIPSKLDIREAPTEVRHAYRKYFKLKTAALEESFMDVEGLEDVDPVVNITPNVTQFEESIGSETLSQLQLSNDNFMDIESEERSTYDPDTHPPEDLFSDNQATEDVWGSHLNKKKINSETAESDKEKGPSKPVLSISKKLFCGSKFDKQKRNPRKSLSLSQKKNTSTSLETSSILSQPGTSLGTFKSEEAIEALKGEIQEFDFNKPIITSEPIKQICSQPLSLNIIESLSSQKHSLRKVDTGWLKRVSESTSVPPKVPPESSDYMLTSSTPFDYDSDEVIGASDDENVTIRPVTHITKKFKTAIQMFMGYNKPPNENLSSKLCNISLEENITNNEIIVNESITKDFHNVINQPVMEIQENVVEQSVTDNTKKANDTRKSSKSKIKSQNISVDKPASLRRSSRRNKVKASFEELSSGEEDPFASDNDSNDPEFTLIQDNNSLKKCGLPNLEQLMDEDEEQITPTTTKRKGALPNNKKLRKPRKSKEPECKDAEGTAHYELEYNVKPRVVAPRFKSIKNVIEKKLKEHPNVSPMNLDNSKEIQNAPKDKKQQAKEKLNQKIAAGNLNENFVTINLRKKVFVRGKKGHNFSKYKKAQWKSKKKALYGPDMDMGGCDGGKLLCFNCGQEGHFAQNCKASKGDSLLPLQVEQEEDECGLPSLEEATKMATESNLLVRKPKLPVKNCESNDQSGSEDDMADDDALFMAEIEKLEEHAKQLDVKVYMDNLKVVKPYYEPKLDGSVIETPQEVFKALEKFGHESFRQGQETAIMRILSGKSTLVTLSTGSGKSLCYQLPAYLYSQREPCISLVISPLVSLMEDQVTGIPKFLKAACLHTNQTETQRQKIMEAIQLGELNVLLISPEAVVAGEKRSGFGSLFRKLPPIAFACIDEAHCVSQWSHNFRPSYLLICRVLKESLGVQTILGLTATATRATCDSIIRSLGIPDGFNGIITDLPLPSNLHLTVSKDANRDRALLNLLLSTRFKYCRSVIVYCTRREECERIAAFLRTGLQNDTLEQSSSKKRKRLSSQAEPYHAGLSASRRRTVQYAFMSEELRVVVATVAFGMGINKANIRAVIHFNMPNSFESYVQEVGRAGRDGLPAECHVFLDSQGRDENELRRHIHANSTDRHVIRKLLQKIFVPCSCKGVCPKHEVAFSIEETVRALDIPEENISTLLCYLELHENKYIELLNPAYTMCKVISYGGPLQIRRSAKDCLPLSMALALNPPTETGETVFEFPVVDVASAMGWESGICKHKLKSLEWITVNNQPKRSNISVQFSNLGFRLLAPGNLSDEQLDDALDTLHKIVLDQETKALKQLHAVHQVLLQACEDNYMSCLNTSIEKEEEVFKQNIRDYFTSSDPLADIEIKSPGISNEEQLVNDIRAMICTYRDNQFTGRAVARILHGIQSPNYPAVIWGRCKFWRSHLSEDFHEICRIATREIIRLSRKLSPLVTSQYHRTLNAIARNYHYKNNQSVIVNFTYHGKKEPPFLLCREAPVGVVSTPYQ